MHNTVHPNTMFLLVLQQRGSMTRMMMMMKSTTHLMQTGMLHMHPFAHVVAARTEDDSFNSFGREEVIL